ncbi:response regulator receiver modulated metal dependent phosphohydrolase [gamma proteobacterium BDW918]|jgi:CheY-like chemotaxis protein|nr:response regulator receiver modulated metal dependent phosphohydrolase [gamma proteobacterium BDW918]
MSQFDVNDGDKLQFAAEPTATLGDSGLEPWKLLLVDDEKVVHSVTRLALEGFELAGRGLQFISAYSAEEAREQLAQHDDIALILLDVVMETDHAGLDLVHYIRRELNNKFVRIVLRTGQPGQAPELEVITQYDINDYKEKTELTRQKLFSTVYTSLCSYRDLMALENNRLGLLKVIEASANIFERRNLAAFAEGVLQQLTALLYLNKDAMLVQPCGMLARPASNALNILAATGCYSDYEGTVEISAFDSDVGDRLGAAIAQRSSNYGDNYWVSYYITESGMEQLLYVSAKDVFSIPDIAMIELFVRNVAIAHETIALLESNNHD